MKHKNYLFGNCCISTHRYKAGIMGKIAKPMTATCPKKRTFSQLKQKKENLLHDVKKKSYLYLFNTNELIGI